MRNDLLDAHACVDWAVSQLDVIGVRINQWINDRPYAAVIQDNAETGQGVWAISEVEPIPRIINAEAGAIINSLRSSLDLLANRLAERNGVTGRHDVYFPICSEADIFDQSGRKKIKRLSDADRAAIERLQPYQGGDLPELLGTLHDMDIARKHRRLVGTHSSPHGISVYGFGSGNTELDDFMRSKPAHYGYVRPRNATDPHYKVEIRIEVSLDQAGPLYGRPIVKALNQLARAVGAVISNFD